ncbi:MAG: hypothetical protein K2O70_00530 [Desulfovibrionaceae bacterium]|nr:hypothetical protein [Desulfovibrionaceae bacterium]
MSIRSVGQDYYSSLYQYGNIFSGSNSGRFSSKGGAGSLDTSELGSLVELAGYAMNAMGVGRNERVTFGQIQKYKEQLEKQFGDTLKAGLASLGVDTSVPFELTVSKDGALQVAGEHPDKAAIQKFLDANPDYGKNIRKEIDALGLSEDASFRLRMDSSGVVKVMNTGENRLQNYFNENKEFGTNIWKDLGTLGIDVKKGFQIFMDENGAFKVSGEHPDKEKIQQYFDEHPELAATIQNELEKLEVESADVHLTMGTDGVLQAENIETDDIKKLQQYFNEHPDYGKNILNGLEKTGVDPNIKFQLTLDKDGKIMVVSDDPDKDKVQKFFDDHPELTSEYEKIQALANLEAARKSMQISPTALRKRIQVESMAAWWQGSGNTTSSIGDFVGGDLSFYSGLNSRV